MRKQPQLYGLVTRHNTIRSLQQAFGPKALAAAYVTFIWGLDNSSLVQVMQKHGMCCKGA